MNYHKQLEPNHIHGEAVRATVLEQVLLPGNFCHLTLSAPVIAAAARAGQFVHILSRHQASSSPLLRRAFSIMSVQGEAITLMYRIVGKGTTLMSQWKIGQSVDMLGPLGKPFALPQQDVLLVGGGVGIPPLAMLASQTCREQPHLAITTLLGARSSLEVIGIKQLEESNSKIMVATDDGSQGHHGYVTELLELTLKQSLNYSIYACGPLPMLRQVAQICADNGLRALLSLEENMPCGIGVCNGCAVPQLNGVSVYDKYIRICTAGPSLWSDQIDWSNIRD